MSMPRVDGDRTRRRRRGRRGAAAVPDDSNYREDPSPTLELGLERPPPPPGETPAAPRPVEETGSVDAETPRERRSWSARSADQRSDDATPTFAEAARSVASDALARAEAVRTTAVEVGVKQLRRRRKPFWVLIGRTLSKAWQDRILGLSAEAGFWQLLSLPPLLLAIFGTIGYVGEAFGHNVASSIENSLVQAAQHFLTASTITDSLQPTIEDVLRNGRPDVISIGFLVSFWSGSTAMATYVNTITIAYGEREARGAVKSRLLALRLYLAQVITGVVLLPALVLGPTIINRLLNQRGADLWLRRLVTFTYWPLVAVLSLTILTSLYHLSVPHRRPWRKAVPGAVLAMGIWLVGCYGLRVYVSSVFDRAVVYGTLAAPVAVLLFFYITAFAVLLGAEFNATLDQARREREAPPRVT